MPDTVRPDGATEIVVHPSEPDRFYVALGSFSNNLREDVRSEIQKSTDGGTTTDVTSPATANFLGRPVLAVVWGVTPAQDTLYRAFHGDSIYKSVDGGSTWTRATGYPLQDVVMLRFAGIPSRLFVRGWTDDQGSLKVSDDGSTFTDVLTQPFVTDVVDAPAAAGVLYAAASATFTRGVGQDAGLYRSSENGTTWTRLTGNLQLPRIWDITTFPDQPNLLYLSSDGDGVLSVSIDDASATSTSFTIPNLGGRSLATAGGTGTTVVGYARIQPGSGSTTPSGIAMFGFTQNGILVSEQAFRHLRLFNPVESTPKSTAR